MALDFSAVRNKLAKVQEKGGGKKDFSKIFFKPVLGKQKVRIVPWKEDKTNPFIEVQFHKYDTFKKYIPTLANWGEADPILEFRTKVYKDVTSTEEEKEFMKTLSPKNSIFVPVIVRGKEGAPDSDVLMWELNKTNFEAVASIAGDEDENGDITDIASGRDLIVNAITEVNPKTKKSYIGISAISVSNKKTPLSDDAARVKKLLAEQTHPLENYTRLNAEQIKALLQNYLNPVDADVDENGEVSEDAPAAKPTPKSPAKPPVAKPKFTKVVEKDTELEEDPELAEEQTPAPAPVKASVKASKAKPIPVEVPDDLPFTVEDDELSDAIPNTPPAKSAPKAKPAAKATAVKPLSIAAKFDDLYGDDED